MSARIYATSTPTDRGMTGAPLVIDHEHLRFLAIRRERKEQEKRK